LPPRHDPARFSEIADKFARESTIIGRLVVGYGELEIAALNCVSNGRDDFDSVFKAMFRVRSEMQRIAIADGLGRQIYRNFGLGMQFETTIANINHCREIRNQYAHCVWHGNTSRLGFVNLEKLAKSNKRINNLGSLDIRYLDIPLLHEQEAYFDNVEKEFRYLNFQARVQLGKEKNNPFPAPTQLPRPLLCLP
jgi:hypothetical protein